MFDAAFYIFLLQLFHGFYVKSETFREAFFEKRHDCSNKVIRPAYRNDSFIASTTTTCAQNCLNNTNCETFSFGNGNCHTGNFRLDSACSFTEIKTNSVIYAKKADVIIPTSCQNGGTLNGQTCLCVRCFAGVECERPLIDCSEAEGDPYYTGWEGVCTIKPDLSAPFPVFCSYKTPKSRTYIQRHYNPGNTFEKSWSDYKVGFGAVDSSDFWIGNEILHRMTSARSYEFVVQMALNLWMEFFEQAHINFQVSDEVDGYRMTYSSTAGSLGDSMFHVNNSRFSTFDNDNDDDPNINCALTRKCGFWFKGSQCGFANPNGVIQQTSDNLLAGVPEEVIWTYDKGNWSPWYVQIWLER